MTQILEPGILGPMLGQSGAGHNPLTADYYVDATGGSDAADGLTPDTAWQTVAKVNAASFGAGEFVAFKRGETWRERMAVPDSGLAGSPITFGAYGAGAAPLIKGSDVMATWTSYAANTWQKTGVTTEPQMVFLDDTYLTEGSDRDSLNDHEFVWAADVLYVRDETGDPDGSGVVIEASQRTEGIRSNVNWVIIQDFHCTHGNSNGLKFRSASTQSIGRRNTCDWNWSKGIAVEGDSISITNNTVTNIKSTSGEGIGFDGGTNGLIQGNSISNVVDGTRGLNASSGNTIRGNTIFDCTDDGIDWAGAGTDDNIFEKNLVYDCTDDGIKVHIDSPDNIIVRNNIVYGCGLYGIILDVTNGIIYHNTVSTCGSSYVNEFGDALLKNNVSFTPVTRHLFEGATATFTTDYNIYYPEDGYLVGAVTYDTLAEYNSNTSQGANSAVDDPDFVDEPGDDFHLLSTSPCRDVGVDLSVANDYDGITRPQETNPAIGAFEFVA